MDLLRRDFIRNSAIGGAGLCAVSPIITNAVIAHPRPSENKISLATWSINQTFFKGGWKMKDLFRIVRDDFGLDGIEHVNQFFDVPTESNLKEWNKLAKEYGLQNVLIMVDGEGEMVSKNPAVRKQSVINHRKWVDIAAYMGCHAIRCNAHGGGKSYAEDPESVDRAAESFMALLEYAKSAKINVIIENHGGLSSDPKWMVDLMKKVDSPDFGILPDYGNFDDKTDHYEAIKLFMPFAKGCSVKAAWDEKGNTIGVDLPRMLKISMDSGYKGFWGIESGYASEKQNASLEDIRKNEWQAVLWTKKVIEKTVLGK